MKNVLLIIPADNADHYGMIEVLIKDTENHELTLIEIVRAIMLLL